jgi:hypothetical protein
MKEWISDGITEMVERFYWRYLNGVKACVELVLAIQ